MNHDKNFRIPLECRQAIAQDNAAKHRTFDSLLNWDGGHLPAALAGAKTGVRTKKEVAKPYVKPVAAGLSARQNVRCPCISNTAPGLCGTMWQFSLSTLADSYLILILMIGQILHLILMIGQIQ